MALTSHPQYRQFRKTMREVRRRATVWTGVIYRSTTMQYANARDLLSGAGSKLYGGRWNPPGSFPVVYGNTTPEGAMAESLAHHRYYGIPLSKAMPRVFVAIRVKLRRVLDLTVADIWESFGVTLSGLGQEDWRMVNDVRRQESVTQAIGRAAHAARLEGLLAPSISAIGTINLVVFPDRKLRGSSVEIDRPEDLTGRG